MEKSPILSIIMPVYKAEQWLNIAVDSILHQTLRDFELILIDDASPDGAGALCDALSNKDARIKVIHQSKNMGASTARNTGLDAVIGEYLAFMDSDDIIDVNLYQIAVETCQKHNAQLVVFGIEEDYFDKDNTFVRSIPFSIASAVMKSKNEVRDKVMLLESTTLLGYQCNKIYHLPTLKKTKVKFPTEEILLEDFFFNIEYLSQISTMAFIDICGYHYMKRYGQGQTSRYVKDYFRVHYKKVRTLYEKHQQWGLLTDSVTTQIANLLVRYTFSALERNTQKEAKLTYSQQRVFLKERYSDELFCTLVSKAAGNGALLNGMAWLLKHKSMGACLAVAMVIRWAKRLVPNLFLLLKQKR